MTEFRIKLLTPTARVPERGSPQSAGLDVRADLFDAEGELRQIRVLRDKVLPETNAAGEPAIRLRPGQRAVISIGIAMATSGDVYTRVAPRSGLAVNNGADVLAGVVDGDYRSEVAVVLVSLDPEEDIVVTHGMRIAQLVLERISIDDPVVVDELDDTVRGLGGFGSAGLS